MARIKVVKKKDIVDPETAATLWSRTREYVESNIRQIAAIALIIVVVAGATTTWMAVRAKAERQALSLFSEALASMEQQPGKAGTTPVPYDQTLEKFKAIRQQYPSTKAGVASLFYAGNCSFNLKKYDDAIAYYKDFLDRAGGNLRYLKSFAYEGMGYSYEMKNDYKEAITWFERQNNEGQSEVNSMALLNLARCSEAEGNRDKACALYKEFLEKQPSSSFKDLAQLKTATLCEKKQP